MTAFTHRPEPQARKSSWIPWVFVGAMLVVVVVNAIMVTFAVKTFTGLMVPKPFERGVAYNRVLEAQHRQDALGWTFTATFDVVGEGLDGRLALVARGAAGQPLDGLALEGVLARPVEAMAPVPLYFTAEGNGRYAARVDVPKPGQWDLKVTARRGDDSYILIERLFLK